MQINTKNSPHSIGFININALLRGWEGESSATSASQFNANMHMTYVDNEAYTYGGQSFSASYLRRFGMGGRTEHELELNLEGILLGASKSDYFNLSGREYDYGPGAGLWFRYALQVGEEGRLGLLYRGSWIHSINGAAADHLDQFVGLTADVPVRRGLALSLDYLYYFSHRFYEDYDDVFARNPMLQLYFSWRLD